MKTTEAPHPTSSTSNVSNGNGTAAALSLQTIEAQQEIIAGLQGIVAGLKGRLAERSPPVVADDTNDRAEAAEAESAALHRRVAALVAEQEAAEAALQRQVELTASLEAALAAAEGRLVDGAAREKRWARERAIAAGAADEARHWRGQARAADAQRRQWRSLAGVLAARADPVTQAHARALAAGIEEGGEGEGAAGMEAAVPLMRFADELDHPLTGFAIPQLATTNPKRKGQTKKSRFLTPL